MIQSGRVKAESVPLIFTSPPYADQRKNNYGGIHPDDYVEWFLPRAEVLKKCLTPDGSFVLNIKEKAVGGQRHTMRQESVMVPMGDWKTARLRNLSKTDYTRDESKNENGFGKKVENWIGRDMAYPTNVLHLSTECGYKGHPAAFPLSLPNWFIRLFTDPGDIVLDPFAGSGTTLVAARDLDRDSIGIDMSLNYCDLIRERLSK